MGKTTFKANKLKIKPEVAEKWIEALRSRKYKQTTSVLHAKAPDKGKDSFCCLGVLCDIAVQEGVIPSPTLDADLEGGAYVYGKSDKRYEVLPAAVVKWAGLKDNDPVFVEMTEPAILGYDPYVCDVSLATLNDEHEFTFTKIARLIEQGINQ